MGKEVSMGLNTFLFCPKCGSRKFHQHSEKSNKCADCGFIFFMNPAAAVAVFIRNERGELLLCTRSREPAQGQLDLPGGFADIGENIEEAATRELQEELGIYIKNLSYLFSFPNIYRYSQLDIPTLDLFFECEIESSTSLTPADDVQAARFFPLDKICLDKIGLYSIRKAITYYISTRKK